MNNRDNNQDLDIVNRFCRDCYQTTPHVRGSSGGPYDCSICKKSGRAIWKEESRKEDTEVDSEEMVLKIIEEKGAATANEISEEMKVPVDIVKRVLNRLETVGMLMEEA